MSFRLFNMTKKKKQEKQIEDGVYAAMGILEEKYDEQNSVMMYLVKWAGKDKNGNEWEPTWEPFENCGTLLIHEWEEKKERDKKAASGNQVHNGSEMDEDERIGNNCQMRQINGKNDKSHQLFYEPPATSSDGNMIVEKNLYCDDGVQNKNITTSECSMIPTSKRIILPKNSTKNAYINGERGRGVSLGSRQVKLFKSISSTGKLFVRSSHRVPDSYSDSSSTSDSEEEIYINGNGAIQFYKYPIQSRSGRLSITRRLECSTINKRRVSPRLSYSSMSEDLDYRKKIRYDEDSYSSEEEILCSGQVFPCVPVTSSVAQSQKDDAIVGDLFVPSIPKATNIKSVDKPVSNSTSQSTISPSTNGSLEFAQKSSNSSSGITTANVVNSSSKKPTDHHHPPILPIHNTTNQSININPQSTDSLFSIAPKPVQTVQSDINSRTTQKRSQTKTRKTDTIKNISQLTVNSSNPPILPKPPTSTNIAPIIRSPSLMNNNANTFSLQNRTIRPNNNLYSSLIISDDNHTLVDNRQQSSSSHRSIGVSQSNSSGVSVSSSQTESSIVRTNTTNYNIALNVRNQTKIPSNRVNHNLQCIEHKKTIERQMEKLSEAQKALAEKSDECEELKNTIINMASDEYLQKENESLKRKNEKLKMNLAKIAQNGALSNPRDHDKLSEICALIQKLSIQNCDVLNRLQEAQNMSDDESSSVPVIARNDNDINNWKRNDQLLRRKLNESRLQISLLQASLKMREESEKVYERLAKLMIDLKCESLKICTDLQKSIQTRATE